MDPEEQALQREGYIQALTSKDFLRALRDGPNGKIAITYFEWAGESDQKTVMPWRVIDGPEAADAVAAEIARGAVPPRLAHLDFRRAAFCQPLFDNSGYRGLRRVIDVSGDGANNSGPLVVPTRDDVVAGGITINGLPIMLKRANIAASISRNSTSITRRCVIGGPGAFVVPIRERAKFVEATRTKTGSGNRQPRTAAARRAGVVAGAAHFLRHRRKDVARPLGRRRIGFSVIHICHACHRAARCADPLADDDNVSPLKLRHQFDMRRIAELIDRRDAHELVAAIDQNTGVMGESRHVA